VETFDISNKQIQMFRCSRKRKSLLEIQTVHDKRSGWGTFV